MPQCPHCKAILPNEDARIRADERERMFTLMEAVTVTIPIDLEMERFGRTWTEERKIKAPLPVAQLRALLTR
jgi:hypothetical protein